jgi:2-iminobutanoate/2-iminopropanoate deaminase
MSKEAVMSPEAPAPGGQYSQAIVSNGFLFTAGIRPQDPATGEIPESIGEQTTVLLRNIQAILRAAGVGMDDVVKSTVHLQYPKRDFAEFNAAYAEFFTEPYPVRTTVGSELNNILVEIDVTVALPVH